MPSLRYSPWIWVGALSLGLTVFGCGESSGTAGNACSTALDCASGQLCRMDQPPPSHTKIVAPPVCLQVPCTTSADCQGGYVCGPSPPFGFASSCPPMVCSPPCQAGACAPDQVCGATSGLCEFHPCDEAGAPACSEHYRCDVTAAAAAPPAALAGSSVAETDDPTRAAKRGCVRKRCDEDAGFACRDYWQCSPADSTDASGCVPVPCAETGHCSSDDAYVCSPTNAGHRPTGTDVNGCVLRNCGEGKACQYLRNGVNLSHCDLANPAGDSNGCVVRHCDEDANACSTSQRCEPLARFADDLGCRFLSCTEGVACPAGYSCDPTSASTTGNNGCLPPGTGGSGAGGTTNVGTGGTGTGGTRAGNAGGAGTAQSGTCVAAD